MAGPQLLSLLAPAVVRLQHAAVSLPAYLAYLQRRGNRIANKWPVHLTVRRILSNKSASSCWTSSASESLSVAGGARTGAFGGMATWCGWSSRGNGQWVAGSGQRALQSPPAKRSPRRGKYFYTREASPSCYNYISSRHTPSSRAAVPCPRAVSNARPHIYVLSRNLPCTPQSTTVVSKT